MDRQTRYPKEVRERAVRLVFEHEREYPSQWAAISSISSKLGMTAETLRKWVRRAEADAGPRGGPTSTERPRMREREREVRELGAPTRSGASTFLGSSHGQAAGVSTPRASGRPPALSASAA